MKKAISLLLAIIMVFGITVCVSAKSETNMQYEYITERCSKDIYDQEGNFIAKVSLEANFRYNSDYGEAKCLSTESVVLLLGEGAKVETEMRTQNATTAEGGAYAEITVNSNRIAGRAQILIEIKCDANGRIWYEQAGSDKLVCK